MDPRQGKDAGDCPRLGRRREANIRFPSRPRVDQQAEWVELTVKHVARSEWAGVARQSNVLSCSALATR
jgi:hypothetical protein